MSCEVDSVVDDVEATTDLKIIRSKFLDVYGTRGKFQNESL